MKIIAINGSHGFLGKKICKYFEQKYQIIQIVRKDYLIDPKLLAKKLEGAHYIVNLAGSPISLFPSSRNERMIYQSRISTTQNLVKAILLMDEKPELFISFSAVGIYGFNGVHDEQSKDYGTNFLSKVCVDWERAANAKDSGISLLTLRCGIVLSKKGGMLERMIGIFRFGLGAFAGQGNQPVPFIHISDFLEAFRFALDTRMVGIVNFVAPKGCTNFELSETLNLALNRRYLFRIPAFIFRIFLGKNAFLVLNGQNVIPRRLLESGFEFMYPEIGVAISNIINCNEH